MKIEEKFVARLSVHSIPVTDARNEETMHGFARRIEATPPGQCALALQLSLLEASALQTCGKCVPCRDGLPQLAKLMRRIVDCEAQPEDLGRLKTLAEFIRLGSDCAIGYDAAQMVLESLTRFADEFKHHTEEQSCQKGIAQSVPCETFCPAHVDVPGYIALVAEGRSAEAVALIRKDNPFRLPAAMCASIPAKSAAAARSLMRRSISAPSKVRLRSGGCRHRSDPEASA